MKDLHFLIACRDILPQIEKYIEKRDVVIWGAGNGGRICKYVLEEMGIKVSFFVDSRVLEKEYEFEGLEVKNYQVLNKERHYSSNKFMYRYTTSFTEKRIFV